MVKVVFDEQNILSVKDEFNVLSRDIYNSLILIEREILTMSESLNTPKSKKNIAEMDVYLESQIKKLDNSISDYNHKFNDVIKNYNSFIDETKKIVGDNNE